MSSPSELITALLRAVPYVASHEIKVRRGELPQHAALPAITYIELARPRQRVLSGQTHIASQYQLSLFASTANELFELESTVLAFFDNFKATTLAGFKVHSVIAGDPVPDFSADSERERSIFTITINYS
jgi:hypothetical protein